MKKHTIILIFLFLLIIVINCIDYETYEYIEEEDDDDDEDDDDGYAPFRKNLKEYLIEHKLNDSDKLVKPKRMKKIFLYTVGDLDIDGIPEHIKNLYEQLADYFVEKYYSKKKEIRGKDVYKLFKFDDISTKFNELMQENPYYGDDDNLKDDMEDPNFRDEL